MAEWISSGQAAALGVKTSSLYAHVSRGLITRQVVVEEGRRVSRFDREEVVGLAHARTRPRGAVAAALIESRVSCLDADGRLSFRGTDVATCAGWGFERTARHILGLAEDPAERPRSVVSMPGANPSPVERATDVIRRVVLDGARGDSQREELSVDHCARVALAAVESSVIALTHHNTGTVAERLTSWWATATAAGTECLSADVPDVPDAAPTASAMDVALSVMVDHELTASTVAARAAASVRADPWMVLLAGLSVLSGPLHAQQPAKALTVLRNWREGHEPQDGRVPGFGHTVYVGPDPRAVLILDAVADLDTHVREHVEGLALYMARRQGAFPNSDMALAALTEAAHLPDDAGEVIFTLARIPGLMAHALEEYPHELRLRLRALA